MVKKCCIKECRSESYTGCGLTFHGIPRKEDMKRKWLDVITPKISKTSKHSVVCSLHFKPENFYTIYSRQVLKTNAVPSVFQVINDADNICAIDDDVNEHSNTLDELNMCRVCLAMDVKMYDLKDIELKEMFQNITGITVTEINHFVLKSLCWECAARLKAAVAFRNKALLSDELLQGVVNTRDQIRINDIILIKEKEDYLKSALTLSTLEVFHIVDIDGENQCVQPSTTENNDTEILQNTVRKDLLEPEKNNIDKMNDECTVVYVMAMNEPIIDVPIITEIEHDPISLYTEEDNKNNLFEVNPSVDKVCHIEAIDGENECVQPSTTENNDTEILQNTVRKDLLELENNIIDKIIDEYTEMVMDELMIDVPIKTEIEHDPISLYTKKVSKNNLIEVNPPGDNACHIVANNGENACVQPSTTENNDTEILQNTVRKDLLELEKNIIDKMIDECTEMVMDEPMIDVPIITEIEHDPISLETEEDSKNNLIEVNPPGDNAWHIVANNGENACVQPSTTENNDTEILQNTVRKDLLELEKNIIDKMIDEYTEMEMNEPMIDVPIKTEIEHDPISPYTEEDSQNNFIEGNPLVDNVTLREDAIDSVYTSPALDISLSQVVTQNPILDRFLKTPREACKVKIKKTVTKVSTREEISKIVSDRIKEAISHDHAYIKRCTKFKHKNKNVNKLRGIYKKANNW